MSRVSVIIPNFNREDLVGLTIANLLAQSEPPREIIVVDDGSTDGSLKVIRSFGSTVKLIQQENQGPGAARNAGLKIATGDYIQFQDSDDLLSLNKLAAQAQLMEATGADVVFGPWAHVFITERQLRLQTCVLQQSLPPASVSMPGWLWRGWFTIFQSLLFRRSFLIKAGSYETDVRYGEDMEYFFRLLACSPRLAFSAEALTLYRLNSINNLSSDGGASENRRVVDWAKNLARIARPEPALMPSIDSWSRAVFLAGVRKHLHYLRAVPAAPPDLVLELSGLVSQTPSWLLGASALWLRVSEQLRLWHSGQRWMKGLQAGLLTGQQRRLIAEMGFHISGS